MGVFDNKAKYLNTKQKFLKGHATLRLMFVFCFLLHHQIPIHIVVVVFLSERSLEHCSSCNSGGGYS